MLIGAHSLIERGRTEGEKEQGREEGEGEGSSHTLALDGTLSGHTRIQRHSHGASPSLLLSSVRGRGLGAGFDFPNV